MKKGLSAYLTCWLILVVLFNLVCFLIPGYLPSPEPSMVYRKTGGAFWAGYLCIMAAFLDAIICAVYTFQAENAKKLFLKIPVVRLSYAALVVVMIVGTAAMVIVDLPNWLGGVVCLVIIALYDVAIVKADVAGNLVGQRETEVSEKTEFMQDLLKKAGSLQFQARSETAKDACRRIYEALRYSDPVSHQEVWSIEKRLEEKFAAFSEAVAADDVNISLLAKEFLALLAERNEMEKQAKRG